MDSDLYDEFGNYIGPDLESDSEEEEFEEPEIDVSFGKVQQTFLFSLKILEEMLNYSGFLRTMLLKMKQRWKWMKTKLRKQLFCTKTSDTIKPRLKCMELMLRRLCKRKMLR